MSYTLYCFTGGIQEKDGGASEKEERRRGKEKRGGEAIGGGRSSQEESRKFLLSPVYVLFYQLMYAYQAAPMQTTLSEIYL